MSEVTKLYENAAVEPELLLDAKTQKEVARRYPLFTAEKQIELIKWLAIRNGELDTLELDYYDNDCFQISSIEKVSNFKAEFEEVLANFINMLWQDLTEAEKQQVKGILE